VDELLPEILNRGLIVSALCGCPQPGQLLGEILCCRGIVPFLCCVCGCGQILTECNHVGCTYSGQMLKELDERVARNEPDDLTLQAFVQEYGIGVMAQPASHGFGLTAWVMPFAVLLIGAWLAWVVIKRWRHRAIVAPAAKVSPDLLARARREMENEE
jgi:cytochrome c-type biogenesis protein CcmH